MRLMRIPKSQPVAKINFQKKPAKGEKVLTNRSIKLKFDGCLQNQKKTTFNFKLMDFLFHFFKMSNLKAKSSH